MLGWRKLDGDKNLVHACLLLHFSWFICSTTNLTLCLIKSCKSNSGGFESSTDSLTWYVISACLDCVEVEVSLMRGKFPGSGIEILAWSWASSYTLTNTKFRKQKASTVFTKIRLTSQCSDKLYEILIKQLDLNFWQFKTTWISNTGSWHQGIQGCKWRDPYCQATTTPTVIVFAVREIGWFRTSHCSTNSLNLMHFLKYLLRHPKSNPIQRADPGKKICSR